MANPLDPMDAEDHKTERSQKPLFSFNFKGMFFVTLIAKALASEIKLRTGKRVNWVNPKSIPIDQPETRNVGKLKFFIGHDEHGQLRGGEPPWQYLQGLCDDKITAQEKRDHLDQTLRQLPSNVSYIFRTAPNNRDSQFVRDAFERAHFNVETRSTRIYRGQPGMDPVDSMKSDARTKIRKARRELELTDIGSDEFFDLYQKNLQGKNNYFFLNIDRILIKQAAQADRPQAEIIAVRRKPDGSGKEQPVEAAAVLSLGVDDGYCRLLRLTFRHAAKNDNAPPPHQHALKMVVVEAMKRASNLGLPLDVDGYTAGGGTVYERFGGFETETHDRFTRMTAAAAISSLTRRVHQLTH